MGKISPPYVISMTGGSQGRRIRLRLSPTRKSFLPFSLVVEGSYPDSVYVNQAPANSIADATSSTVVKSKTPKSTPPSSGPAIIPVSSAKLSNAYAVLLLVSWDVSPSSANLGKMGTSANALATPVAPRETAIMDTDPPTETT